ncbi:MAG TPA: L-seryl-tRNA(Sec) selenium transferase, partial [Vicinamibacteria bacterium]
AVEQVLQQPAVRALEARFGPGPLREAVRRRLDDARRAAAAGDEASLEEAIAGLPAALSRDIEAGAAPSLVRVINATGVIVHTNLGRAPLSAAAAARVAELAAGYSNLEYDLARGARGQREDHAEARLRRLLGAGGTVVVNNNAAAVLLAVNTFAQGREVLVSRGELVEIGGSFRIPDIVAKGGARLREVGTTNRTRLADYRAALGAEAGLILKVHPSNFRIVGFTEAPGSDELAALAREAGLPLVEDLGSGLLAPLPPPLDAEPTAGQRLAQGVDLVTMSGDKLLGGPQAGLVAGRRELADAMRRNPLYRALRVDKMTLAALDVVLAEHEAGRAAQAVPVAAMLSLSAAEVQARAEALARALAAACPGIGIKVRAGASAVGGGAAPEIDLPTALLAVAAPPRSADDLAAALRGGRTPVVARVADDRLLLDLRTVALADEAALLAALVAALKSAD